MTQDQIDKVNAAIEVIDGQVCCLKEIATVLEPGTLDASNRMMISQAFTIILMAIQSTNLQPEISG